MEKFVIRSASPTISTDALLAELHMDRPGRKQSLLDEIMVMHQEAMKIASPVALYAMFSPKVTDGKICINGVRLEEEFVYEMLSACDVVIPYVASCGTELEAWSHSFTDVFKQLIADTIKKMYLYFVKGELLKTVQEKYFDTGKSISTINPGSLDKWPIQGQQPLFTMLGGVTDDIGVVLSDKMMMLPTKSVSGIIFQTDVPYHNCQLCPRVDCPARKAPYDDD